MIKKIFFSNQILQEVLLKYKYDLNPGDIVAGTIYHEENEGFLVDIGHKNSGYLPKTEITSFHNITKPKYCRLISSQTRDFFVMTKIKKSNQLLLSIKRLDYIRSWKRIKQIEKEDAMINAYVYKMNAGGVLVQVEGLIGFIPKSHLIKFKEKQNIKCQFLFTDERKNQLILSQKKAVLADNIHQLRVGDNVNGQIMAIKKYGLFVRIYNIYALLHISEIGDKHIKNIFHDFQVGQTIQVQIRHIDIKQARVFVSTRNFN